MELILSEFAQGKLTVHYLKNTSYYREGVYHVRKIVDEKIFSEFMSQIRLGIEINEIIADTSISPDEISRWYHEQLKILNSGVKNNDFIQFNIILMKNYLDLRRKSHPISYIKHCLHITDEMTDFWYDSNIKELDFFKLDLDDIKMDLILEGVNSNLTKEEILEKVEITDSELKRLLDLGCDGVNDILHFMKFSQETI